MPVEPKRSKKRRQCWTNTSVASSCASGKGLLARPLDSASAYGSRHHELTLICKLSGVHCRTSAYLCDALLNHLAEHLVRKLVRAVLTRQHHPGVTEEHGLQRKWALGP